MTLRPYEKITASLLSALDSRTQSIMIQRFGLQDKEPQTLEAIGQSHGITRERVRQIVEEGIHQAGQRLSEDARVQVGDLFSHLNKSLAQLGHVKREDLFIESLQAGPKASHMLFLMHLKEGFWRHRETQDTHAFWSTKKELMEEGIRALSSFVTEIDQEKRLVHEQEIFQFSSFKEIRSQNGNEKAIFSILEVSKYLMKGYDGRWGLRTWPEVNPRGVREKAYIVLKEKQVPLHFRAIAQSIAELQRRLPHAPEKPVLSQTVHNELIKDARFVLVGRGTYALAEWGYLQGTVKDVLIDILKRSKGGLTREELLSQVLSQRQVKDSTVMLNLQDRTLFARTVAGRYQLK
ncbi:MAG: HTH domain-containing protein [Candidatus Yanofskybacteria bacterium]|nr:HTH domain-containing protein [Candidatus Yanofskybacteria bacterium]